MFQGNAFFVSTCCVVKCSSTSQVRLHAVEFLIHVVVKTMMKNKQVLTTGDTMACITVIIRVVLVEAGREETQMILANARLT